MRSIWTWLKDDKNRDIVRMAGAGLAAVIVAGWAVFTFVGGGHSSGGVTASGGSIAAGHDISGGTIAISRPGPEPPAPGATPGKAP